MKFYDSVKVFHYNGDILERFRIDLVILYCEISCTTIKEQRHTFGKQIVPCFS